MLTSQDSTNAASKYRARMGSLRAIDDLIGTIGASLEAAGELEGTAFLFTSDNGYHYGEHRLAEKLDAYEESIRVPLTMAIPGVTGGQVLRQYITNNDLAPTLVELAGTQAGITTDGRSFLPLFDSPTQPWRKRFLVEQWWELGNGNPNQEVYWKIPDYAAVRTSPSTRYVPAQMYVEYADPDASVEFYDLHIDPNQLASLHADPSPMRALQRSIHAQWLTALKACHGESCRALEFFDR